MLVDLFRSSEGLSALSIIPRSILMYFIALLLLRMGGIRIIGKKTGMDLVIMIMLGSILARGIMENTLFVSSIIVGITIVIVNRFLLLLSAKYNPINYFLKGRPIILFTDGEIVWENMTKTAISLSEIITSLRLETNAENFDKVSQAYLEPNGRISFILIKNDL